MNNKPINSDGKTQKQGSVNFGVFMATVFVGHGIGAAIFVGMVGIALDIPGRKPWVLPYVTLVCCGLVLSPLLYWARLAREQPKTCAIRFGITMFLYLQVVIVALGFSTVRLDILSLTTAINDYALFMLFLSVFASVMSYGIARQMLKVPQSG